MAEPSSKQRAAPPVEKNSQTSIIDSHDAWIGGDKKPPYTSFSFSKEWTGGQKEHFTQGHRVVGSAWDFPF